MINLRILFLKILKLPAFQILLSRLFQSITAEDKNEFFKKLCFVLKKVHFQHFYWCKRSAIKELVLKDTEEIHFCKIYKSSIILELVHLKTFPLK